MTSGRRSLLTAALALLAVLVLALLIGRRAELHAVVDHAVARCRDGGPLVFFAAMAVLPAVGFPLAAFTVVAGPVFAPTMGVGEVVACSIAAVSVNVALCYWLATKAVRPLVLQGVRWLGYQLPEIPPHAAWPIVLLVRIVPGPPFFLQSYLLGLAGAPFSVYLIVSVIVPSAYLAGTIVFTDALVRGDRWAMAGAMAIFVVAGAILHQLRRRLQPAKPATASTPPSPR